MILGVPDAYSLNNPISQGSELSIPLLDGCGVFSIRCDGQSAGIICVKGSTIKYYTAYSNESEPIGARFQASSDGTNLTISASQA